MGKTVKNGKIGIFDSGLGGLFTLKQITKKLPNYEYIYLGDTKRVPYGNRSQNTIYQFLREGVDFLFSKNCSLIIVACNTASAEALRKIQQEYLPKKYPGKRVLGVIVPIVESIENYKRIGMLATKSTVESGAYTRELQKRNPTIKLYSIASPLLVPLIEEGNKKILPEIVKGYLNKLPIEKIDVLVLGCTHYGVIKSVFKKQLPKKVKIISQEETVPKKLKQYLEKHKEITSGLSTKKTITFYVTDKTKELSKKAALWFGKHVVLHTVHIENNKK